MYGGRGAGYGTSGRGGGGKGEYYRNRYGRKREVNQEYEEEDDTADSTIPPASVPRTPGASRTHVDLDKILHTIDGRGYGAYREIEGQYTFPKFVLTIDRVQGDPYAPPSKIRVRVPASNSSFPVDALSNLVRRIGLGDYLSRRMHHLLEAGGHTKAPNAGGGWSGPKGGDVQIEAPGQHILQRTSCTVSPEGDVEVRLTINLPAAGRSIQGSRASVMLVQTVPQLVQDGCFYERQNQPRLMAHIRSNEDQDFLRKSLQPAALIAFVRNGAILPRASGAVDTPLASDTVVPFKSPPEDEVSFTLPNCGKVSGMGIRKGVTLIVGGGFHGKSTLLDALQVGVYNHIPGDGREFVSCDPSAVKVRAEDGRAVQCVDISPFIGPLPLGRATNNFTTENASGSTSQAANVVEALEAGARVLLMDEDTSASNFMIRDKRMQMLVSKDKEPISPFILKVRSLFTELSVSTILVIGGSGDFFDVSDHVVMMDNYVPRNVTKQAKSIALSTQPLAITSEPFGRLVMRYPTIPHPAPLTQRPKVSVRSMHVAQIGDTELDLSGVEQIVETSQTRAIVDAILHLRSSRMTGKVSMRDLLDGLDKDLDTRGLDALTPFPVGNLSRPRIVDLAAAINRLRTLRAFPTPS